MFDDMYDSLIEIGEIIAGPLGDVVRAAATLFDPELEATWASSSQLSTQDVGLLTTILMICFSASLKLLTGALGASFESQHHFRQIIFVDEEI